MFTTAAVFAVSILLILGDGFTGHSSAQANGLPPPRVVHAIDRYPYILWRETWGGAELLANSWSVYTGSTFALGGDIEADGWRLRTTGGYGQYTYKKRTHGLDGPANVKFTGRKTFTDLLGGYQTHWDRLTLRAFAGLASEQDFIDPRDVERSDNAFTYGGKLALEAWLAVSDDLWVSGDASWTSARDTYKLGMRTGLRVVDNLGIGLEARFDRDETFEAGRAGAFATLQYGDAGLTVAAGMTGDRDMQTSTYGSINLFYRY